MSMRKSPAISSLMSSSLGDKWNVGTIRRFADVFNIGHLDAAAFLLLPIEVKKKFFMEIREILTDDFEEVEIEKIISDLLFEKIGWFVR